MASDEVPFCGRPRTRGRCHVSNIQSESVKFTVWREYNKFLENYIEVETRMVYFYGMTKERLSGMRSIALNKNFIKELNKFGINKPLAITMEYLGQSMTIIGNYWAILEIHKNGIQEYEQRSKNAMEMVSSLCTTHSLWAKEKFVGLIKKNEIICKLNDGLTQCLKCLEKMKQDTNNFLQQGKQFLLSNFEKSSKKEMSTIGSSPSMSSSSYSNSSLIMPSPMSGCASFCIDDTYDNDNENDNNGNNDNNDNNESENIDEMSQMTLSSVIDKIENGYNVFDYLIKNIKSIQNDCNKILSLSELKNVKFDSENDSIETNEGQRIKEMGQLSGIETIVTVLNLIKKTENNRTLTTAQYDDS